MPEESTTTDLVELQKWLTAATNRGDVDAIVAFYAPDAVYDMSPVGMGVFEGQAAARGFIEDWWTSYEESEFEAEETLYLEWTRFRDPVPLLSQLAHLYLVQPRADNCHGRYWARTDLRGSGEAK
jgi:hypothetical protein